MTGGAPRRRLNLAVGVNSTGWAVEAARWPGTRWNRFNDFEHYRRAAELAREGVFDAIFLSDQQTLQKDSYTAPWHTFDPTVLFAAIASAVPDVGFLLTGSTSYNSPYNMARRLATLDAISGGRVMWNAVSSFNPDIAANFSTAPLPPRAERYRRADEFLDLVKQLWLSWDAPEGDAPAGDLWDETTARPIDHHGEFFDVRGPLNVPIGPQGYPVICQAGASNAGLDLAGKHAEVVYASTLSKQAARDYAEELSRRAVAHGRAPDSIRLFPGMLVVLGDTREEALRRHEALEGARDEDQLIADFVRHNWVVESLPDDLDPDEPLDPALFATDEGQAGPVGFTKPIHELTSAEDVSLRQLVRRLGGGHRLVVGTAQDVADAILDWWEDGAIAGFNLQLPVLLEDMERFVRDVIPILQHSGAYPTEYDGATIRDRFGLPDPRQALLAGSFGSTAR